MALSKNQRLEKAERENEKFREALRDNDIDPDAVLEGGPFMPFDPSDMNVDGVKFALADYVDDDPSVEAIQKMADAEKAGKNRVTVLEMLENAADELADKQDAPEDEDPHPAGLARKDETDEADEADEVGDPEIKAGPGE